MTDSSDINNIRVVVRIRPLNSRELDYDSSKTGSIISVLDERVLIFDPKHDQDPQYYHGRKRVRRDILKRENKDLKFAFDRVFASSASNLDVYNDTTKPIIDVFLKGFNCSVFAYGATGAGKTHTMLGREDNPGVILRTMEELYRRVDELKADKEAHISVSYLEVYNEKIKDLLKPSEAELNLREDGQGIVTVPGLSVHTPANADELFSMLERGNRCRTQHPTDANKESSRSHAVFQVYLRMRDRTASLNADYQLAKLSLIDLAGSERATVTTNRGDRLREGANINRSLLALGNVINALADARGSGRRAAGSGRPGQAATPVSGTSQSHSHPHVPYRNSKLTRLLKDSLGGNCATVMIAAVSTSRFTFEDTYNTLRYADRAKQIRADLKRNVFNVQLHIANYAHVVEELHAQVDLLKNKLAFFERHCGATYEQLQRQQSQVGSNMNVRNISAVATDEMPSSDLPKRLRLSDHLSVDDTTTQTQSLLARARLVLDDHKRGNHELVGGSADMSMQRPESVAATVGNNSLSLYSAVGDRQLFANHIEQLRKQIVELFRQQWAIRKQQLQSSERCAYLEHLCGRKRHMLRLLDFLSSLSPMTAERLQTEQSSYNELKRKLKLEQAERERLELHLAKNSDQVDQMQRHVAQLADEHNGGVGDADAYGAIGMISTCSSAPINDRDGHELHLIANLQMTMQCCQQANELRAAQKVLSGARRLQRYVDQQRQDSERRLTDWLQAAVNYYRLLQAWKHLTMEQQRQFEERLADLLHDGHVVQFAATDLPSTPTASAVGSTRNAKTELTNAGGALRRPGLSASTKWPRTKCGASEHRRAPRLNIVSSSAANLASAVASGSGSGPISYDMDSPDAHRAAPTGVVDGSTRTSAGLSSTSSSSSLTSFPPASLLKSRSVVSSLSPIIRPSAPVDNETGVLDSASTDPQPVFSRAEFVHNRGSPAARALSAAKTMLTSTITTAATSDRLFPSSVAAGSATCSTAPAAQSESFVTASKVLASRSVGAGGINSIAANANRDCAAMQITKAQPKSVPSLCYDSGLSSAVSSDGIFTSTFCQDEDHRLLDTLPSAGWSATISTGTTASGRRGPFAPAMAAPVAVLPAPGRPVCLLPTSDDSILSVLAGSHGVITDARRNDAEVEMESKLAHTDTAGQLGSMAQQFSSSGHQPLPTFESRTDVGSERWPTQPPQTLNSRPPLFALPLSLADLRFSRINEEGGQRQLEATKSSHPEASENVRSWLTDDKIMGGDPWDKSAANGKLIDVERDFGSSSGAGLRGAWSSVDLNKDKDIDRAKDKKLWRGKSRTDLLNTPNDRVYQPSSTDAAAGLSGVSAMSVGQSHRPEPDDVSGGRCYMKMTEAARRRVERHRQQRVAPYRPFRM